jgi:hypothetical protein
MRDTFSNLLHVVASHSRDSFSLVYRPAYRPHAAKVWCIFGVCLLVVGRLAVYFGRFYGRAIFASLSSALAAFKVSHARCVAPR